MSGNNRPVLPPLGVYAVALGTLLLLTTGSTVEGQSPLFDGRGYRIDGFRSPVPDCVPGARTVHTTDVIRLVRTGIGAGTPILIDVLPSPPRPKGLNPAALWLPPVRQNIPNSVWLPNVGYGRLSDELESYFRDNLRRLTDGDPTRPLIIYCLADCWMSWNAARRAAEYGYSQVLWYPEGSDGWTAAQLPLTTSVPVPMH